MNMLFGTTLRLIALLGLALPLHAEEPLRVAAAISLRDVLTAIASDFEKDSGKKVEFTFGSSGQLLAQIQNGAPIDVFISAAHDQIDALEREHLSAPGARRVIAGNRLVLIVPKKSGVPLTKFEDLAQADVKRVAIGEPTTVPAGQYARQVLEKLKLVEPLHDRLVYGMNVRQVLDYVTRGEVTAGIVYATDARAETDDVKIVATADESWHKPVEYPAVPLKSSRHASTAEKYCAFLVDQKSTAVFKSYGFTSPPKAASRPAADAPTAHLTTQPSAKDPNP
jgi:molybdate transport system substrate-binding protein